MDGAGHAEDVGSAHRKDARRAQRLGVTATKLDKDP